MYRFIWKIKLADHVSEDEFVKFWKDSSAILQEYPGAQGTIIHRARDEEKTYFLVAQWESQAARDAMQADIDAEVSDRAKRWNEFPENESFGEIQVMFAGEQIDVVGPSKT